MISVRGKKRSDRDPERVRVLVQKIQRACREDGRFRGMTEEEVLEKLRQTREEVWNETKHEAGTRR
jgi:hypothetical protein